MTTTEQQSNKVYDIALDYYDKILAAIPVDEVTRKLVTKRIINLDDKQLIKAEKSDTRQAEYLLDNYIMKRVHSGEVEVFDILLEAMRETGRCDSLLKEIYSVLGKPFAPCGGSTNKVDPHRSEGSGSSFQDNERVEVVSEVISNQRVLLTQKLSSDELLDHLVQSRLVDDSVGQKLSLICFTNVEKNRMIIECLQRGPPDTLKRFCAILRTVKKYSYIADALERERSSVISQLGTRQ